MNYGRLVGAAVAATVFDAVYGFLVYGLLLAGSFANFPGVYRSAEAGPAYLPGMFACILVGVFLAACMYAKGYEGGSGASEGVRFGVLLGMFVSVVFAGVNYATLNIGRRHSLEMAAAAFIEWLVIGTIIGVVYKPSPAAARRTVRV